MGKGNVGVAGAYEGLFYIDNEDFHVYRRNDDLDDWPETCLMGELDYAELTGGDWLYDEEGRCAGMLYGRLLPEISQLPTDGI